MLSLISLRLRSLYCDFFFLLRHVLCDVVFVLLHNCSVSLKAGRTSGIEVIKEIASHSVVFIHLSNVLMPMQDIFTVSMATSSVI